MDERLGWVVRKKTHKKVPKIKVRVEREQLGRIAELCVLAYERLDNYGKDPDLSDPAYWESKRKAMEAYHLIKKVGFRYKVREDCATARIDENETNVLEELGIEFEILETTDAFEDQGWRPTR